MHYTILNHGQPWVVTESTTQAEVQKFIALSTFPGSSLTDRPANASEIAKFYAGLALHQMGGGNPSNFFGTSL
jgi:hypothetical protein